MVLFFCMFLALRSQDSGKEIEDIQDHELAGEKEIFAGRVFRMSLPEVANAIQSNRRRPLPPCSPDFPRSKFQSGSSSGIHHERGYESVSRYDDLHGTELINLGLLSGPRSLPIPSVHRPG